MSKPDGAVLKKPLRKTHTCKSSPGGGVIIPAGYTQNCGNFDCPYSDVQTIDSSVFPIAYLETGRKKYLPIANFSGKVLYFIGGWDFISDIWLRDYIEYYDAVNGVVNRINLSSSLFEPTKITNVGNHLPEFQVRYYNYGSSDLIYYFVTGEPINSSAHVAIDLTDGTVTPLTSLFSGWSSGPSDSGTLFLINTPPNPYILIVTATNVHLFDIANNTWVLPTFSPGGDETTPLYSDYLGMLELDDRGTVYVDSQSRALMYWAYYNSSDLTWYWGYSYLFKRVDGTYEDPLNNVSYVSSLSPYPIAYTPTARYDSNSDLNPSWTGDGIVAGPNNSDTNINAYSLYVDETSFLINNDETYLPLYQFCNIQHPIYRFGLLNSFQEESSNGNITTWYPSINETIKPQYLHVAYFSCPETGLIYGFLTPFREIIYLL